MSNPFPSSVYIDQARDFSLTTIYANASGTPINLTGYSATFSMATQYSSTPFLTANVGSGVTITAGSGQVDVRLTNAQTDLLAGNYYAELVITSGSGVETSLLKGQIVVKPRVGL
jgi:hypothetical protein